MDIVDIANDIIEANLQALLNEKKKTELHHEHINAKSRKCRECGGVIDHFRATSIQGTTRCLECQSEYEYRLQIEKCSQRR